MFNRKYRQIRYSMWSESIEEYTIVEWCYQLEYSYLGIIWNSIGPIVKTEQEIDEFYENFIKPKKWMKYYK